MRSDRDHATIRRMRPSTLRKLTCYMAVDLDYRRAVVDHIALMTDAYAEEEIQGLYGFSRLGR